MYEVNIVYSNCHISISQNSFTVPPLPNISHFNLKSWCVLSSLVLSVRLAEDEYVVDEDDETVEICVERIGESADDTTVSITAGEQNPASAEGEFKRQGFINLLSCLYL